MQANAEGMLRQRRVVHDMVPGGERLGCRGLKPALQVTPDGGGLRMQSYECEAYYWVAVANFADALATIDPPEGARIQAEAEAYRRDLLATVEIPTRHPPRALRLRLRCPGSAPLRAVAVGGRDWTGFDPARQVVRLEGHRGLVHVEAPY